MGGYGSRGTDRRTIAVSASDDIFQPDRVRPAELTMAVIPGVRERIRAKEADERGQVMLALLVAAILVTVISVSLVGLMNTDMSHASIQYAVARSFYIAQAGLEEAKVHVFAAADPVADATPAAGVTEPYGGGQFTYWVDAGPAAGCGDGLKTLEALGQAKSFGGVIPTRVRACAVPGVPFLTALFGVSRVEFQGASRTYLAPYDVGSPGGGGNVGSFTEVNFSDQSVRVNALSEETNDTVTLRDNTFLDYMLFGFPTRPSFNPTPTTDPTPWILSTFGDLIKAQSAAGPIPNRCGTPYACATVGNRMTDVQGVGDLREAAYMQHVYVKSFREEVLPPLALDLARFQARAGQNTANAALNRGAGLSGKVDSFYTTMQFFRIVFYLASHPEQSLQGTVYIDGSFEFFQSVSLGGTSGNVTLAVGGDLIIGENVAVANRHDLSTVAGRRTPAIVVLGARNPADISTETCGRRRVNWSGGFVMCEGSTLAVDGLVYTQDGMAVEPGAFVDQVGAMYHNNRGTGNPSFTTRDATVVLRFDPLALSAFGKGAAILSWQQLH